MGARKLSYHVPSIRGYDEKSLKKITLFSKVDTGIFSVFYPKNRYDYSPLRSVHTEFGMLPCSEYSELPNRHEASNEYRYGFQGQELDNEIKGEGHSVNYKYRMHDPRIGRFFAVDPLTAKYPFYSPYSFSGNKVIHAVELEGLEEFTLSGNNAIFYGGVNGKTIPVSKSTANHIKKKYAQFFNESMANYTIDFSRDVHKSEHVYEDFWGVYRQQNTTITETVRVYDEDGILVDTKISTKTYTKTIRQYEYSEPGDPFYKSEKEEYDTGSESTEDQQGDKTETTGTDANVSTPINTSTWSDVKNEDSVIVGERINSANIPLFIKKTDTVIKHTGGYISPENANKNQVYNLNIKDSAFYIISTNSNDDTINTDITNLKR